METECCPKFDPKKWDEKKFIWKNKPFIKESIPALFHMPFPPMIGKKIIKMMKLASEPNKISSKKDEILVLFRDPTPFKSEILISVTGKVIGAKNINLSGTFIAKVYSGGYNQISKFVKDMNNYLIQKGNNLVKDSDYYIHYAYCPKCAKKYGDNYMILFAKVK